MCILILFNILLLILWGFHIRVFWSYSPLLHPLLAPISSLFCLTLINFKNNLPSQICDDCILMGVRPYTAVWSKLDVPPLSIAPQFRIEACKFFSIPMLEYWLVWCCIGLVTTAVSSWEQLSCHVQKTLFCSNISCPNNFPLLLLWLLPGLGCGDIQ